MSRKQSNFLNYKLSWLRVKKYDIITIMKKIILILILLIFTGCSHLQRNTFTPVTEVLNKGFTFEPGDILILKKKINFHSEFGHSALVLEGGRVAEYPAYGYGYVEVGLSEWLEYCSSREMAVLRVPLSDEQKVEFMKLIEEYSTAKYGVFNRKFGTDEFYCSSFVWRVYYDLGFDLDKNFNFLVLPYDFLKSEYLKKVEMQETY